MNRRQRRAAERQARMAHIARKARLAKRARKTAHSLPGEQILRGALAGRTDAFDELWPVLEGSLAPRANAIWRDFLARVIDGPPLPTHVQTYFERIWISYGTRMRNQVGDDGLLADALRDLLRAYSGPELELFRGQSRADFEDGVLGLSWANNLETASTYARAWDQPDRRGGLVLLRITAGPPAIISMPSSGNELADAMIREIVVDPRLVGTTTVVDELPETPTTQEAWISRMVKGVLDIAHDYNVDPWKDRAR